MGIFWDDPSVLVASLHADPDIEYPYTSGFADQVGGPGAEGGTLCLPLPAGASWEGGYGAALAAATERVADFGAEFLIVSLGVDTIVGDPVSCPRSLPGGAQGEGGTKTYLFLRRVTFPRTGERSWGRLLHRAHRLPKVRMGPHLLTCAIAATSDLLSHYLF